MEQNMQWRRQGVNKESATVITCIDLMFQQFDARKLYTGIKKISKSRARCVCTMIPSPTEKQVMAPFQACGNSSSS